MEHLLNNHVSKIQISGIRQIADKIRTMDDIVSLTIGEPDFYTPNSIKNAGIDAILKNQTFYAPTAGLLDTRKAACEYVDKKYYLTYSPENECIITNGTTESLYITLRAILNPGDEVLIPTPTYPGYEPIVVMCGATLKPIDVSETNFKLTKEQLENHLTEKTKAIILPYPSNPTGAILTEEELGELEQVLKEKNIFIISDELYSELTFETYHTSIASFSSLRNKTIVINGLSKSHAMTGWRVGFVFAPAYITKEMLKIHQYANTSVNTMAQVAAVEALKNGEKEIRYMKEEYRKRRDYLYKELQMLGFGLTKPESTFYLFPNISNFSSNSYEFSMKLLEEAKVGILPSTVFTHGGESHVRISFAYSMEKLEEAIKRMKKVL